MDGMRRAWANEVRWWSGNLQARCHGSKVLSSNAGDRNIMRACASAAAVYIAGAVVLGTAWGALAKRWRTPSRTNLEPVKDHAATNRAFLVAFLRAVGSRSAAVVRSPPLLLLCAAPGEKAPRQTVAKVPALVPAMPLSRAFLSDLPLFVGVDGETGELVVLMKRYSIGNTVFPMTTRALGRGRRSARWRRQQQAAQQEATSRTPTANILCEKAWGPAFSRNPPLLLLCAAKQEETPSVRQIDTTHAPPTLALRTSLPSLTEMGAFLLSIPMLVGVGDTAKKLSILEVPKTETVTSLFLARGQEKGDLPPLSLPGLLLKTTLPLLLCDDQGKTPESLGSAATTTDLQTTAGEGVEVVVATTLLDSPSKMARRASSSPSTSSSPGESLWTLPSSNVSESPSSQVNKSQPSKTSLKSTMLWGLPVVKRDKPAAGGQANTPPTTASLGQPRRVLDDASADPAQSLKGGRGVSNGTDGGSGSGGGGASSTSSTNKRPHTLWALPGQARLTAGVRAGAEGRSDAKTLISALGESHGCSISAEVDGKPVFIREGEGGTSDGGDYDGGGVGAGAGAGARERLSLSGSPLRSALALSAEAPPVATPRGRADVRSPSWALGKARRGSLSPARSGKSVPSQSDGVGGGRGGRAFKASPSRKVAVVSGGGGTTRRPPAPRSILVTSKGPASARRVTAISRGVRWLDIVQKEEEQAISRRKRAARWTGSCRKREGPPTAAPRASRALVYARESEVAAAAAAS